MLFGFYEGIIVAKIYFYGGITKRKIIFLENSWNISCFKCMKWKDFSSCTTKRAIVVQLKGL